MTMQLDPNHYFQLSEIKDGHSLCPKVITTEAKKILKTAKESLLFKYLTKSFKRIPPFENADIIYKTHADYTH